MLKRWMLRKNRNNDWGTNFMPEGKIASVAAEAACFYVSKHAEPEPPLIPARTLSTLNGRGPTMP